jgi:hypothetical protein
MGCNGRKTNKQTNFYIVTDFVLTLKELIGVRRGGVTLSYCRWLG